MKEKKPFNKQSPTRISFTELLELIGTSFDYKFCIIDENVDEELIALASRHGIDLKGYKHVIETSGVQHSENRHGVESNDREPLSIGDYLLIPYIIRNRDRVDISTTNTKRHKTKVLVYEKRIGLDYYYVEEIRTGKKSLAFHTLYKRATKKPTPERSKV